MERAVAPVLALALFGAACGEAPYDLDGGDDVALGAAFALRRQCGSCHEAPDGTLSGRSTPLANTAAYPANLTPDRETGLGEWADIEIVRAIRYGFDNQNQPLCPPMTHVDSSSPAGISAFAGMDDLEARAIVAYLRSLAPVAHLIPASRCPPIKPPPPVDGGA